MSTTGDILPANEPVVRLALPEDGARVLELVGKLGHCCGTPILKLFRIVSPRLWPIALALLST